MTRRLALLVACAAAALLPATATAAPAGVWYTAGYWSAQADCVAVKDEFRGNGSFVQPATNTCFSNASGYYFKHMVEF